MLQPTANRITIAAAGIAGIVAVTSHGEGTVDLGKRVASKDEIVDILKPKRPPVRRFVTRGLKLNSTDEANDAGVESTAEAEQEASRSLSLTVNFEFDSARLTDAAIRQLTPLAAALAANELKRVKFTLQGHTDAHGTENYNLALSDRRAMAVKAFLADQPNVDLSRISAQGMGETELIDSANPYSERNRRVVVIAE